MIFRQSTNFRRTREPRIGRGARLIIAVVGALLLVLIANRLVMRSSILVGSPLWRVSSAIEELLAKPFMIFSNKFALIDENEMLMKRVLELETFELLYRDSQNEINALRTQSTFVSNDISLKRAVVLSPSYVSPYATLFISAGRSDGLSVGDFVYSPEGVVIGEITAAFATRAQVGLLWSDGNEIDVVIDRTIKATARGVGHGAFRLNLPHGVGVEVGALISLVIDDLPLVAKVENVTRAPNDSFIHIDARSPVTMEHTPEVVIPIRNR